VDGIVGPKTWAKLLTARLSGVEPGWEVHLGRGPDPRSNPKVPEPDDSNALRPHDDHAAWSWPPIEAERWVSPPVPAGYSKCLPAGERGTAQAVCNGALSYMHRLWPYRDQVLADHRQAGR
jgi:hypothetical protein